MFSRYFRNRMQNFPLFLCEHQQTMMSKNHTPPTISSARPTEPDSPAPRGPPPARATPASHARRSKVQLQIAQMEMQMAKIKRRDVSVVSAVDVHYPAAELLAVRNNYRPHQHQILVLPSRTTRRGPSLQSSPIPPEPISPHNARRITTPVGLLSVGLVHQYETEIGPCFRHRPPRPPIRNRIMFPHGRPVRLRQRLWATL